jgi:hypothetical protein
MPPTNPPPDPPFGVAWLPDDARSVTRLPDTPTMPADHSLGQEADITRPGGTRPGGFGDGGEGPFTVDALDRLSQRLAMAGLRLASLRRRLAGVEDRMMLIQASDDLDEAIAEVRRLALTVRNGSPA